MTLSNKSAYTISHADKPMPKTLRPIMDLLGELGCKLLHFRWSRRGVPHIILQLGSKTYSICYFKSVKLYKVFYPYPGGSLQEHHNCGTPEEVIEFIRGA